MTLSKPTENAFINPHNIHLIHSYINIVCIFHNNHLQTFVIINLTQLSEHLKVQKST